MRWFNATAWYGLYISRLLREAGHETLVIGLPDTASFAKAKEWGLEPVPMPMNSGNPADLAPLYGSLSRLLEKFGPHVVNCHRGESFWMWGVLKNNFDFALVRTRGDQRPPKNNIVNRILHNKTADALIATNSLTAGAFTKGLGTAPEKVFTILGGVDTGRFHPDAEAGKSVRGRLALADDDFIIGLLGRLDPVKGHEVLIQAAAKAQQACPGKNIRLVCIGDESNLKNSDLEQMAAAAGFDGKLIITGRVDNVRAYINALDLGVLASTGSEAIARAALEIIACDVPLLSTDVGVMPDILPREALVPVNNPEVMADALVKCLSSRKRLEYLRGCGARALDGLRPDDFLRKTLDVYNFAIDARN